MRTSTRRASGESSVGYPTRRFRFRVGRVVNILPKWLNTKKTKIQYICPCYLHKREQEFISSGRCHVVVIFVIPLLVGLLQVDFQSKNASPFQTHPVYMWASFIALCIYCIGLWMKKEIQTYCPNYSQISRHVTLISGALSSVLLASIFLQHLLGHLIFLVWALLLVMVGHRVVLYVCRWFYQGTMKALLQVHKILKRFMRRNFHHQQPPLPT